MKWRSAHSVLGPAVAVLAAVLALPVAAQFGRPTRPVTDLPAGPIRQVILKNCTSCHGIDDYAYHALDRAGWQSLIETFCVSRGARVSDRDREVLLDYLVYNFGPDYQPFPRTYIPPEITEFFSDDDARNFMERTCTRCHSLDRVFDLRYNQERWRAVLVDMRVRGATLTDEDLERLVEWLFRVRGTAPVD